MTLYKYKLFLILFLINNNLQAVDTSIGTVNVHSELFHYDMYSSSRATAIGGFIKYESLPYNNFGVGFKAYGSKLILESRNPQKTSLVTIDGENIYPIVENYIYYKNKTLDTKIGYFQLDTPLLNNDNSRLIPFSYKGIEVKYKTDNLSQLILGHINKFRFNTSDKYAAISSSGYAKDGVSFIGYKTIFGNVNHQWYYYNANQLYNSFHIQVDSQMQYNKKNIIYGLQGIYTFSNDMGKNIQNRANGGDDVKLISAKLGLQNKKSNIVASMSYNFGNDGISRAYGGLSSLYTSSMVINGKGENKPLATSIKARYKYYTTSKDYGYSSAIYLTNLHYMNNQKNDISSIYIDHKMKFRPREYILFRYEKVFEESNNSQYYFRIISAYEF